MAIDPAAPRTRRAILAAGLGGLAATVLTAVGRPSPVAAANGDPILAGSPNAATASTVLTQTSAGFDGLRASTIGSGGNGVALKGTGTSDARGVLGTSDTNYGVSASSSNHHAIGADSATADRAAIFARSNGGTGIIGYTGNGTDTPTAVAKIGVYGYANQDANARAVYGKSLVGTGVWGNSDTGRGLFGRSTAGTGVSAQTDTGRAVYGTTGATDKTAILGQNTNGGSSGVQGFAGGGTPPAPEPQTGVDGVSNLSTDANGVHGGSTIGTGVWGTTSDGIGVIGSGTAANSIGVLGDGSVGVYASGGVGLLVDGPALFSTSGKKTITSGSSTTITVPGGVVAGSIGLAVLQTNKSGLWVRAVTTNPTAGTITVYLNTTVAASTVIGWFVIN